MTARPPLWLAAPSRFARLSPRQARIGLALLGALLALALTALATPDPTGSAGAATATGGPDQSDLMLYEKIVAGMKGGGGYYTVASDALRAGGYPLRPFFTVRMPALAVVQAALPPWATLTLLFALAGAVGVAWGARLGDALPRLAPRIAATLLLVGSMLAFLQPGLAAFHEIWAGLLVALSLALRRRGRWIEAVAVALMAMLIRETAALYALVMAAMALRDGERREALGWIAALALLGAALAAHAHAVTGVTLPSDPRSPGWAGLLGFGFFVRAIALATALHLLPLALAALLAGLSLFGWASWRDEGALRVLATIAAYALLIAVFARLDTFYWALMVAPIFLVGLLFVPDGLRDLVRQALDRRRITVTRVAR